MEAVKIKDLKCEDDNNSTVPIHSLTVDTIGNFSPLDGPNGIGKRKFMITDILNNTNKLPCTRSGSPKSQQGLLYHHSPPGSFVGSAFQHLSSSTSNSSNSNTGSISTPHFELSSHHPAAAAAAMAAIGAAGSDLRLYSNFLPAAALQQIQQHREHLMMSHQRANSDNDDRDDTPAPNSNDVDVEEDTQGDSEGSKVKSYCNFSLQFFDIL